MAKMARLFSKLALMNLLHGKWRTVLIVAAIANVVMLNFFQIGLHATVKSEADKLYRKIPFDLALVSSNYINSRLPGIFPLIRLEQCRMHPQVQSIVPFYIAPMDWHDVHHSGSHDTILALAAPQDSHLFYDTALNQKMQGLRFPLTVLFDRLSRPVFGKAETNSVIELNGKSVTIIGEYELGLTVSAPGTLLISDDSFAAISPAYSKEEVSIGLIRLLENSDPAQVAQELRALLPNDIQVMTKPHIREWDQEHMLKLTSMGVILTSGAIVVALIGTLILYQVVSSEIINNLPEYGTLRAIGYSDLHLIWIIVQQTFLVLLVSFMIGFFLALFLYWQADLFARLEMTMTVTRFLAVGGLMLGIGLLVCLLSARKLLSRDPADVF